MSMTDLPEVYQLRIRLCAISPLIWRRLLVLGDTSIADLHNLIQLAFGWTDSHLHRFVIYGKAYGIAYAGGLSLGTAQAQGSLWGARARDYAEILEQFGRPLYEAVFQAAGVGAGTWLLDVGCGPGLAAHLAAQRGAQVAGLDTAETSLAIARERTPEGDFRAGEMEDLPWAATTRIHTKASPSYRAGPAQTSRGTSAPACRR